MPPLMHSLAFCHVTFKLHFILHKALRGFEVLLNRVYPPCMDWTTQFQLVLFFWQIFGTWQQKNGLGNPKKGF
jgi:hypothetical protein